jgi:hypothetical protein
MAAVPEPPQLNGAHFRVTVVEERGFVDFHRNELDGSILFSGYCIDLLNSIARPDRANFTFELLPPSGTGSLCELAMDSTSSVQETPTLYDPLYYTHYNCGQSDVTDVPASNYTTDLYLSLFYITPTRQLLGKFSMPFAPPHSGRNVMFGTAINIRNVEHFIELQKVGHQKAACMPIGAATTEFVQRSYPDIQIMQIIGTHAAFYEALKAGLCQVIIFDHPIAALFVLERYKRDECIANGMPIGIIGEPFTIGLGSYGIGIRNGLSGDVVRTIDYWLNMLMTCAPADPDTICPGGNGSLDVLYAGVGATGHECGYVPFPVDPSSIGKGPQLSIGGIAGVVLGTVALVAILGTLIVAHKLREQRRRFRKRFVQQIARNIAIGHSPGSIPAHKLAEQVQHIGDKDGVILKEDLRKWMYDVKLEFISESDFEALWAAMDIDGSGKVDAIEFFIFMSSCGPQFEEVYNEEQNMPKLERLKLAARRLSVINSKGEAGVRKIELRMERNSRNASNLSRRGHNGEPLYSEEMKREVERAARCFGLRRFSGSRRSNFSEADVSETSMHA